MARCPAGLHADYDDRFYRSCPDCPKVDSVPKTPPPRQSQQAASSTPPPRATASRSPLGPTKLFWDSEPAAAQQQGVAREEIEPISGWLVAVNGPKRGKAFPLFFGRNSVGRDLAAVVFIDDQFINREILFTLTFDYRLNKYTVEPAPNSRGLVHLDRRARYFFDPKDGSQLLNEDLSPVDSTIRMLLYELETKEELTQEWNWYIHIGKSLLRFVPFFDRLTVWEKN